MGSPANESRLVQELIWKWLGKLERGDTLVMMKPVGAAEIMGVRYISANGPDLSEMLG